MNHSVRSLLPSLLLIGIYFIADEFFGTVTGVWVAFLLGGAEFIYTRIREKVYDKMILLTTLFFCIPGLISIWANGSVLSQLQPAIIETALCLLLGFFAFSHTDFTHTLPAGYRKNIHLSGPQLQSMRKCCGYFLSSSPYIPYLPIQPFYFCRRTRQNSSLPHSYTLF